MARNGTTDDIYITAVTSLVGPRRGNGARAVQHSAVALPDWEPRGARRPYHLLARSGLNNRPTHDAAFPGVQRRDDDQRRRVHWFSGMRLGLNSMCRSQE